MSRPSLVNYIPGLNKNKVPREAIGGSQIAPLRRQSWVGAVAANTTYFINAVALPAATAVWLASDAAKFNGSNTRGRGVPDYARSVRAVCSGTQTGNIIVTGLDISGRARTETIALTSATAVNGKVAFARVDSISVPAKVGSETISIGFSDVFGLDAEMSEVTVLKELENGVVPSSAGTFVVASGSANADRNGTYDPASAANGSLDFVLYYIPTNLI